MGEVWSRLHSSALFWWYKTAVDFVGLPSVVPMVVHGGGEVVGVGDLGLSACC